MHKTSAVFFAYCAFLSVFLLTSGILNFQKNGNPFVLIMFLPVVGYFMYHIAQSLLHKIPPPVIETPKGFNVIVFIVFAGLVSGSLYTVLNKKTPGGVPAKLNNSKPIIIMPSHPKSTGIIQTKGSFVNIRKTPSTQSETIGRAQSTQKYPILQEKDGWTSIQLDASQSGWIRSDFISILDSKTSP